MEEKDLSGIPGQDNPEPQEKPKGPDPLAEAKAKFNELLAKQRDDSNLAKPIRKTGPKDEEEAPVAEPEKQKKPEKPAELTGLRQRLVLAGIPRKLVEPLSDSEVAEVWKKQEERENAAADAIRRASELEKQLAPKAAAKSEPLAGVPTDEVDLEALTSTLSDQFGEEESQAIANTLKASVEPLLTKIARLESIIEAARKSGEEREVKTNRARLSEKLSMLKENDAAWNGLEAIVRTRIETQSSKYPTVEAVFDEVFGDLYGEIVAERAAAIPAPEDKTREQKARIAASATSAPATSRKAKEYGPVDAHRAAYETLLKNPDDVEGARKNYGRYVVQ